MYQMTEPKDRKCEGSTALALDVTIGLICLENECEIDHKRPDRSDHEGIR